MSKMAYMGGAPIRKEPFPSNMIGASMIGQEELNELADVVREKSPFRHYGIGNPQKVNILEQSFAEMVGVKYALAVSSGSAALMCAIVAANLGPDDEVIVPCFSWYSDYCAPVTLGVTPVFADISDDLNLDPTAFEAKITPRTKAVIIIHFQGCPAKMDKIMEIARKHNLIVIEDCAQACGGSYHDKRLGSIGDIAIYSFQTHKILTAGEGGMIVTNNEEMYVRAVRFHDLGFVRPTFVSRLSDTNKAREEESFAGMQFRMSELTAAFLLAQLRKLDAMLSTCRNWHRMLREHVEEWKQINVRFVEGDCGIAFIMHLPNKEYSEKFNAYLSAEGIPCQLATACCNLLHKYPIVSKNMVHSAVPPFGSAFKAKDVVYDATVDCLKTDAILEKYVSIGIGPCYKEQEIMDIIAALDKVYSYIMIEREV